MRINNVLVASYLYDHRGLRGRKTLSNPPAGVPAITLYTYDPNGHLFQEIAGSGNNMGQALVTYLWQDDVPAAIVLGPNTPGNPSAQDKLLYLEVDHLNTPRVAKDEQKRVVWRWDSDAFGSTAPNEDPDGDGIKTTINMRFAGQYFDAESGLHYNWHRYYDPQTGRYTQPDPIGVEGGVNPYAYVGGNPHSYVDIHGLQVASIARTVASLVAGGLLVEAARPRGMTPREERQFDRHRSGPGDPCEELKKAAQSAIADARSKMNNMLQDPKKLFEQAFDTPNPAATGTSTTWVGHRPGLSGMIDRVNAIISLGQKMGCNMSAEIVAAGSLYVPNTPLRFFGKP